MTTNGDTARGPRAWSAITAMALNTFREAIRDRILYLLLAFALILIVGSRLLSLMTVGDEEKIIKDLGLATISLFGTLTAVFVGVSLVFKEIERRTVFTLLANPLRRWQFIAGKYVGLLLVLAMNLALMSAALSVLLAFRGEAPFGLFPAILLILVELAIVTAFAILFSSFANPILAALGTLSVYVAGHLSWSLELLKNRIPEGWGQTVCDVLYAILPNLHRLDIKAEAVHGFALPAGYLPTALVYGISYALVVVLLSCLIFERRDFV